MAVVLPFTSFSGSFLIDIFLVGLLGLALGSFASVLAYRGARGLSWFSCKLAGGEMMSAARSACPRCKTRLRAADLVPLFSWLFLRGRCRYCRDPVPVLYPLLEVGSLCACVLAYAVMGPLPVTFVVIASVPFLLALLAVDIAHMILPNSLILVLAGLGVAKAGLMVLDAGGVQAVYMAVGYGAAGLLYGAFAWSLGRFMAFALGKEALGMGDVKFFAVAGLWLGIAALPAFCILSGIAGIIFALLWRFKTKQPVFPFGPALIVSFYIMVVFGEYHFW